MPDDMAPVLQDMISSLSGKIEQRAERGRQAQEQLTPLMLASKAGQEDVVRNLLERGDDVNIENDGGWTALKKAVSGHHPTIVRLLVQHGANVSASPRGYTALHLAAQLNDVQCSEALLDCGADMNVQEAEFGQTPLLEAMNEGDGDFRGPEVARLLIEHGADVTIKDMDGRTVLNYALDYYDCWIEFADSVWLGQRQLDLIELVRRTAAHQALR